MVCTVPVRDLGAALGVFRTSPFVSALEIIWTLFAEVSIGNKAANHDITVVVEGVAWLVLMPFTGSNTVWSED